MTLFFNPRFWIGLAITLALAGSHFFVYRSGKAVVRSAWDAERQQALVAAGQAAEKRRLDERSLSISNQGVSDAYMREKNRIVAAAAITSGKLRRLQAALDSGVRDDTAASGGVDDPRDAIISQCAGALTELDGYSKGVAAKATALQGYARQVCLDHSKQSRPALEQGG